MENAGNVSLHMDNEATCGKRATRNYRHYVWPFVMPEVVNKGIKALAVSSRQLTFSASFSLSS